METDLYALAFDLGYERKRTLEALQRIQSVLLNPAKLPVDPELRQSVLAQVDQLARSAERLATLTTGIESKLAEDRIAEVGIVFEDAARMIEEAAASFGKPVSIEIRNKDMRIDAVTLGALRPILLEMLVPFVEYSIEERKERAARKKPTAAKITLTVRASEEGHRVSIIGDGNGIIPPFAAQHGPALAKIGVRARFEGQPGEWSSWHFFIPLKSAMFKVLPVKIEGVSYCIPNWAVVDVSASTQTSVRGDWFVEVAAGLGNAQISVDEVGSTINAYMKPLHPDLTADGRYMGVVYDEKNEESLWLVLDPSHAVYPKKKREIANAG